jgi:hypothetical protein
MPNAESITLDCCPRRRPALDQVVLALRRRSVSVRSRTVATFRRMSVATSLERRPSSLRSRCMATARANEMARPRPAPINSAMLKPVTTLTISRTRAGLGRAAGWPPLLELRRRRYVRWSGHSAARAGGARCSWRPFNVDRYARHAGSGSFHLASGASCHRSTRVKSRTCWQCSSAGSTRYRSHAAMVLESAPRLMVTTTHCAKTAYVYVRQSRSAR